MPEERRQSGQPPSAHEILAKSPAGDYPLGKGGATTPPKGRTKTQRGRRAMKRLASIVSIIAAAMVGIATSASAEELVLKFATLDVPQAHLNVRVHHPWAAKINQQAKGVFRIDVFDGEALANHGNVYNQVVSNVVQIAWGLPSLAGKFPLLDVAALPYVSNTNSETASTALWRLYKTGLLDKEFDQVVPLKLIVFPQSGLQFRKEPRSLESLSGLKIIAGSKIASEIVQRLGGAPLSFRVDEYYETLQRGTADGVLVGWTAFNPFKLAEVTHYHLEVPLGGQSGYIFMAKKEWDALPDPVRKILAANSGEGESRAFGRFWDEVVKEGRDQTMAKPGHKLMQLTAAQEKIWHEKIGVIAEQWSKAAPENAKVLATYKDLLAKVAAGE
jgi:TRAP-type C4-dicarboxylate transport system substrate-binding protein